MQRKYAHTGNSKAWGAFPDNIKTISIWDELFIFIVFLEGTVTNLAI